MRQNLKLLSFMQILVFVLIILGSMPQIIEAIEAQKRTTSPHEYFGFQLPDAVLYLRKYSPNQLVLSKWIKRVSIALVLLSKLQVFSLTYLLAHS